MEADYLVVGAGLTGAVIARRLVDHGLDVVVLERRPQVGGNVRDHEHVSGIRIHTYGPHFFRTSSDRIWAFANRFGRFYGYVGRVQSRVDGRLESWPVTGSTLRRIAGPGWQPLASARAPRNFEEASLAMMPRAVYEKFVKGYTEKQWGRPPAQLDASLAGRFEVRWGDDTRLKTSRHQGLPVDGYSAWIERMLAGIRVVPKCDYLEQRAAFTARRALVYTGPVDAWFGRDLGALAYRAQRREHRYHPEHAWLQPVAVINEPSHEAGPHVRSVEWKHLLPPEAARRARGTVLTRETPYTPTDVDALEYPFQDGASRALYARYRARAEATPGLEVCGRLGDYRYYDMDQAIARALVLGDRLLRAAGRAPSPL